MAGLQVFNSGNFVQIDGEYKNLRLTAKGTMSIPGGANTAANSGLGYTTPWVSHIISGSTPVVAFRSTDLCAMFCSMTATPGQFQLTATGNVPCSLTYYVFDQVPAVASNSGLQVFNAGGELVFDSNDKALRVVDLWNQGTVPLGSNAVRDYGAATVAVIPMANVQRQFAALSGLGGSQTWVIWPTLLAHRVFGSGQIISSQTPIGQGYSSTAATVDTGRVAPHLVVDVAGF